MELREGYKQTEVGPIPEDWTVDQIKNHCDIKTGGKNTQDRVKDGAYPFFVRSQTVERINSYTFDGEAVLTAGDGVGTGKVFHYINGKFDCHQRVYRMSNFSDKLDGYYFYLYFSNNFYGRISQMTAKSSVDSVRMEMIADMNIPLPPTKTEQSAIATALSDVDALITQLEKLITKKRQIKQGAMQTLLNPFDESGELKDGWREFNLGAIAEFGKGKGLPKSEIKEGASFECIHYGELFTKYREKIVTVHSKTDTDNQSVRSKANDILMPTSDVTPNGLATASCITKDNVILGGDILIIRPSSSVLDGVFFSYLLSTQKEQVMKLVSGSTVYHLYGSDMAKFNFFAPIDINKQTEISKILVDMDSEILALESKLDKIVDIKQGMMQSLLTGQIRLVDPAPKNEQ